MGTADVKNLWMYMQQLEDKITVPEVVPHEQTDLHRVFCDAHFCLERSESAITGQVEMLKPREM